MSGFQCVRCHQQGRYSSWVTARWSEPTVNRCPRCGTAHSVKRGEPASPLGPELQPVTRGGRLSPWYDARYAPYRPGWFECEFRDELRVRLLWDGSAWTWCALVVDTSDMVKWRGCW